MTRFARWCRRNDVTDILWVVALIVAPVFGATLGVLIWMEAIR